MGQQEQTHPTGRTGRAAVGIAVRPVYRRSNEEAFGELPLGIEGAQTQASASAIGGLKPQASALATERGVESKHLPSAIERARIKASARRLAGLESRHPLGD